MSYDARGFGWVRVKKADEREIAYVLEESGFEVGRRTDEPGTGFVRVEVEYPYVDYYASGEMEKAFGDVAEGADFLTGEIDFASTEGFRWRIAFSDGKWTENDDYRVCFNVLDFAKDEDRKRVLREALTKWAADNPSDADAVKAMLG